MRHQLAHIVRQVASLLSLAILLGVTKASSQRNEEVESFHSFINPRLDNITLARVGPWTISATEFALSYEYGPAFVKRSSESKKHYLNFMIYEKLLALDASERHLDRWPDVQRQLGEIEADLATEELYKNDVLNNVRVSETQIRRAMEQEQVHLTLRWIFSPSAPEMDEHIKLLKSGVSFDSLFHQQLHDGVKDEDRSMETTKFKLRMQNPMFATVVDTLPSGATSLPIHGPDGWYLVNITDAWTNPILTQSEEVKLGDDVQRALAQHIGDSLSDNYVQRMIVARTPTILREPFNAVQAFLGTKHLQKQTFDQWGLAHRNGAKELNDCSHLDTIATRTLVQLDKGSFSVGDFLEWYRMRELYVKLTLTSPEGFFQSVEQLIWRMVRDRLLTQRAYERGMQKLKSVKRQKEWWRQKLLFIANKQRIGDTVTDSLPLLRKFYEENSRHFTDDHGNVKSFDEAKEDVWREYYANELTKRMLHEVLRLKQKYGVDIKEDALKQIPVDIENQPRAIDVYTVKKGGIYPRLAFPSIDYDWQSWN